MSDPREVTAEGLAALNAHDNERIRAVYADGAVLEAPGPVRLEGGDQVAEYVMVWLRAFPDARQTVTNEIASGDWVVQEFRFTGTHTGTLSSPEGEIPPTHRSLNGTGVQIARVQDGKIVEEHVYFDQVDVLTQLGVMPEPAAA
jgi:predicted ester cyclase